uniref:DNA replication complex GINS protein PSF3 N-terminal domain-containing protein n=1 Tax=Alexandrium catenella TaxID=2925 RepID=A0A7S1M342_ALECA
MPFADFWDVDEILAEQEEVTIRPVHDVVGGGLLYSTTMGLRPDLAEGAKVQVPFWLAQGFARRNTADIELPTMYGQAAQEDLQRDPTVCRLGMRSRYYFEVGVRLASLMRDQTLCDDLMNGLLARWQETVAQLGSFGVARAQNSPLHPGSSIFPSTLTALEEQMYYGGQEAETHFKSWIDRFATYKMKASQIAEAPPTKKMKKTR